VVVWGSITGRDVRLHHHRQLERPRRADNSLLPRLSLDSLLRILAADWVLPFVYNIGLAGFRASVLGWLFLSGLVSLEQMLPLSPVLSEAEGVRGAGVRG